MIFLSAILYSFRWSFTCDCFTKGPIMESFTSSGHVNVTSVLELPEQLSMVAEATIRACIA